VVICFSASNLIQVADQIPGKRFVFADNDASKTGENSAIKTGLPWTMADTVGWDANDLHLKESLFSVVKKIMELRQRHMLYSTPCTMACWWTENTSANTHPFRNAVTQCKAGC
jgi:hypothetical protein